MTDLRALLLTDVVDSTRVAEGLGDAAMATHWLAHDRAARELLRTWRGREIEKTDGLMAVFDTAADAVDFALGYHRALATLGLPFKARVGLHVGPMGLRESSADDMAHGAKRFDIDGLVKPITARVMGLALGGQTLITADARLALGVTSVRLQSHGHWRLKGLPEPLELFEAGDGHAPFTPPPDEDKAYRVIRQAGLWLPVREVKHSLPAERDSFVGREAALAELARRFDDDQDGGARLVSVLGMGGTGKTRLVTRFAWMWLGAFPGGVWFCDLSQARSADGIVFAVAQGLDVPLGKTDPVVQLAHAIAGRGRCLVILDNFEQVARHAEETVGRWLDRAPQARFIVTSREVLGIVGEDAFALAPLPASDAALLFHRRAESATPAYQPGADDRAAVEQLVKVLDGLPLAIELAAARVRVMAPRMLLARMNERFRLLWSHTGRQDRQATLRAAFDWSWELLSPAEQAALAQLSVFEGGFSLETAEAVLDLSATGNTPWVVDVVHGLVDKSFVRQIADNRFDLLESVREYAAEHLRTEGRFAGSGEASARAAQQRHWRYFARLDEPTAVAHGCVEANNLVTACRRAVTHVDAPSAVGALLGAWAALKLTGPFRAGAELAALVESMPNLMPEQQVDVAWVAGSALDMLGDVARAARCFETGLAIARDLGEPRREALVLLAWAPQRSAGGHHREVHEDLVRALDLATACGDLALQCFILNSLGSLADELAQFEQAKGFYEASLTLARTLGDRRLEGGVTGNLGGLHHTFGRTEEARRHYDMALRLAHEVGDRRWEGNARCNLGLLHHEQGRAEEARDELEKALLAARALGHIRLEGVVLCNLGLVLEAQGNFEAATRHCEQAVAVAQELGDRRAEGQYRGYLGLWLARLGRLTDARTCLATGETLLLEVSDQVGLGLLLCSRAESEQLAGEQSAAVSALRQAQVLFAATGVGSESELGRRIERHRVLFPDLTSKAAATAR